MKNKEKYATAASFLIEHAPAMSQELSQWIESGGVKLIDHTAYIRKEITGAASIYNLIDDETSKIDGVSTIKGKSFNKNEGFIFDQVSVAYGTDTGQGKEGAVRYFSTNIASLNNANLVITQNGRLVLDLPVSNIMQPQPEGLKQDEKFTSLTSFAYLIDDQPMEWTLRFPSGVPLEPRVNLYQYLQVKLKGLKTLRNIS